MWLLLLRNWKLALAGVLVLVALAYVASLKLQLTIVQRALQQRTQEVAEARAATALQNQFVETWKQAAVKQQELRAQAEARAATLAKKAASLPIPNPPAPQPACHERDSWLRSELNLLLWR